MAKAQRKKTTAKGVRRRTRKHHRVSLTERPPLGAAPGTLIADPEASKSRLHVLAYGAESFLEIDASLKDVTALVGKHEMLWVDVIGLRDVEVIRELGRSFGIHMLALEDIVHGAHRSKVDEFDEHLFITARVAVPGEGLETEPLSVFVGDGFLLSFQERSGDCFEPVRERLRQGRGRIRSRGSDYLTYALLDAAVDHFGPLVDGFGDQLDEIENRVFSGEGAATLSALHEVRHELHTLRRILLPLRSTLVHLQDDELPVIKPETVIFLRNCQDHVGRLIDGVESFWEVGANLMDVQLAVSGLQLNEVMKVLTIISTIFIPLSFVAGVYGMNFDRSSPFNMPELGWKWGYLFAWGVMVVIILAQLFYFRRKGWLGVARPSRRRSARLGEPHDSDG